MSATKKSDNVKEFKKQHHGPDKKRLTWALSLAFLILVVAIFVLSPVAGAFVPKKDSIVFGEYDGEPIEYAYGNYFYKQQQNIAAGWKQETTDENYQWQIYQIWKKAFDNTVIHMAIMQEAKKMGVSVTDDAVDSYLLTAGPYIDETGAFSAELYTNTSPTERVSIRESVRDSILYQTIVHDMFSTLSSEKEIEFIESIAQHEKGFDYVVFPLDSYPEDRVKAYAQANMMLFTEANISMITLEDDEDAANSVYDKLVSGEVLFEDAARNNSIDGFAQDGGEAGWFAFYDLATAFDNEDDVHEIFSLQPNEISKLYKTQYGYSIFRLNESPRLPDLEDAEELETIRKYIIRADRSIVEDYFLLQAETFASKAESMGFAAASSELNLDVHSAAPTPLNYNNSVFMKSFSHTDPDQYLASIVSNETALKALYTTDVNSISQPISMDDGVLVAFCKEDIQSDDATSTLAMFYPYMVQQIKQQEFTSLVFKSDKLKDNFLSVFFSEILNNG